MIKLLLKVNELGVSTPYNASRVTVSPLGSIYYQVDLTDEQVTRETVDEHEVVIIRQAGMKAVLRGLLSSIVLDADESF